MARRVITAVRVGHEYEWLFRDAASLIAEVRRLREELADARRRAEGAEQ